LVLTHIALSSFVRAALHREIALQGTPISVRVGWALRREAAPAAAAQRGASCVSPAYEIFDCVLPASSFLKMTRGTAR